MPVPGARCLSVVLAQREPALSVQDPKEFGVRELTAPLRRRLTKTAVLTDVLPRLVGPSCQQALSQQHLGYRLGRRGPWTGSMSRSHPAAMRS